MPQIQAWVNENIPFRSFRNERVTHKRKVAEVILLLEELCNHSTAGGTNDNVLPLPQGKSVPLYKYRSYAVDRETLSTIQ